MTSLQFLLAALLLGIAVALAAWAGRAWLWARYQRDVAWLRETYARFHPEPINAPFYMLLYYLAYLAWFSLLLLTIPSVIVVLLFFVISLLLPGRIIAWRWQKRLAKLDQQIPQVVSALANSMRAGLTLVQAVSRVSQQAPEPIRTEFKIMSNQYGYGADMETVINNAKSRLNLPNFNLFATALILNREMGGDISDTLTRISKSLDKLREMRKTVEAHTSEGRANIRVLLVVPVAIMLLMFIFMPSGMHLLFTTAPGWAILCLAGAIAGTGVYIARRITRTEI